MDKIGLQLYSIKENCAADFPKALRDVSDIGYDGVEFAGYHGLTAAEVKAQLDALHMVSAGAHLGVKTLSEQFEQTIKDAQIIGHPFLIIPALPEDMRSSKADWLKTADLFNGIAKKLQPYGITLGYHNHDFEFRQFDGEYGLDILVNNTDPSIFIELDTFWVEYCGLKSVDFMRKYGKRCSVLHIKDMLSWDNKICTEIGHGVMDFEDIIKVARECNEPKWYTIEQEEFEIDYIQAVKEDYQNLHKLLNA